MRVSSPLQLILFRASQIIGSAMGCFSKGVPRSFRPLLLRSTIVILLVPQVLAAQQKFPFDFWHDGKLVLDTRDTLRGLLKYNMQNDMVQVQSHNQLGTYTARKVVFFEIFDQTVRRYRQFYSLPYAGSGQYKTPVFF